MEILMIPTGLHPENAYLIIKDNKDTLVVDPGADFEKINNQITQHALRPVAIVLTHAHYDHIGAVDAVRQAYSVPVYIHEKEADFLTVPRKNLSFRHEPLVVQPADVLLTEMGNQTIEGFDCRVVHIPGHSPGSVAYIFEKERFAVVGDTLFKGGCGRTDLPGSSTHSELMAGIREHLMTLSDDTTILSGHGDATTVGEERAYNPYLNGMTR